MINKHKQGIISELFASSYFVENDYIVSKPITDFYEYDLIIDNNEINRIQVKTIYWDNSKQRYLVSYVTSHMRGNNKRVNKKYHSKLFDYLCAVNKELNIIYLIPIDKIINRRSITFYPKGKPKTVTNRFNDFEKYKVH